MIDAVKFFAFILLIIGTVGLLLNEFIFDLGKAATLTFAVLNLVGLILLALRSRGMMSRD